jgi:hypothetical protein
MNWSLLLPLLITTFTAVGGWLVVHRMAAKRDQMNKRRDLRIQYLIDAYRKLERASNRDGILLEHVANVESAIADIQLFGSARQVAMAKEFASHMAAERKASADALLAALRQDLRRELMLEVVSSDLKFLRIRVGDQDDQGLPKGKGSIRPSRGEGRK